MRLYERIGSEKYLDEWELEVLFVAIFMREGDRETKRETGEVEMVFKER